MEHDIFQQCSQDYYIYLSRMNDFFFSHHRTSASVVQSASLYCFKSYCFTAPGLFNGHTQTIKEDMHVLIKPRIHRGASGKCALREWPGCLRQRLNALRITVVFVLFQVWTIILWQNQPDWLQNFRLKSSILTSVTTDHSLKRKCHFVAT